MNCLRRHSYRAVRIEGDLEALATGKPQRILRRAKHRMLGRALGPVALVMVSVCCTSAPTPVAIASPSFTVTSTLDGQTMLPQRIHWEATPSIPSDQVTELDFLIDE